MTLFSFVHLPRRLTRHIPRKIVFFAGLALFCHWLLLDRLSDVSMLSSPANSEPKEVTVELVPASPAATMPAPAPLAAPVTPLTKQRQQPAQPVTSPITPAAPTTPADPSEPIQQATPVDATNTPTETASSSLTPSTNNTSDVATTSQDASTAPAVPQENQIDLSQLHIVPPPSGTMQMKLIYVAKNMNPVYGVGRIDWVTTDRHYDMHIEASLDLLLTTLRLYQLQSEGSLGAHGIAPRTMTESRRGRSETATHFHDDTNMISFSATTNQIAMTAGAQDKASIFMQLAGIGIASPEQFVTGRKVTIQVAENREANAFEFVIQGQEEITTPLGKVMTWHVIRPPRPGFYNATLELWFAPAYHWYPLQIRNTEPNGAVTTQTVTQIQFNPTPDK